MKKIILFATAILTTLSISAQKIEIKESIEKIGGANNNSLSVNLYGVSVSDAENAFKAFMKKYDGKRNSEDGEIFIDNALIKEISDNTIDVYGKAIGKKEDKDISFIVAFNLGGAFVNSITHKDQFKAAEKIVKDFAIKATKDAIEEELKAASKVLTKQEDAQKDLEKDLKHLEKDIEDFKDKIKKAEGDIVVNKSDQGKKKAEIETQKKVVADITKKLSAVN